MDQDNRDLEEDTPEDLNRNHVSDKYQSQNIQIIDGIEFEKVGGEWFPVTTKDPKVRRGPSAFIMTFIIPILNSPALQGVSLGRISAWPPALPLPGGRRGLLTPAGVKHQGSEQRLHQLQNATIVITANRCIQSQSEQSSEPSCATGWRL